MKQLRQWGDESFGFRYVAFGTTGEVLALWVTTRPGNYERRLYQATFDLADDPLQTAQQAAVEITGFLEEEIFGGDGLEIGRLW